MASKKTNNPCENGHNYKSCSIGTQYSSGPYYEHLGVVEYEEPFEKYVEGKSVKMIRLIAKLVDTEPGDHFQIFVCAKCGDSIERCVKTHGNEYAKAMKKYPQLLPQSKTWVVREWEAKDGK